MNERKSPHEMTIAELSTFISELQSILHHKVCGDPRVGVTLPAQEPKSLLEMVEERAMGPVPPCP